MATVDTTFLFTMSYPLTDATGNSFTPLAPRWNEVVTLDNTAEVQNIELTNTTPVSILPAVVTDKDQYIVVAKALESEFDANKYQFVVSRTDSGAVVHQMYSDVGIVAFSMETGDTALTIAKVDATNDMAFQIIRCARN